MGCRWQMMASPFKPRTLGTERRQRVLILPAWYPWPDRPGLGSFCRDHADAVSLLHDVVVVTWRRDAMLARRFVITDEVEDGLRTVRIQVRPARRPRLETLWTMVAVLVVLARLARTGWRADVVHAHEFQVGLPAVVAAVVSRAPLIVSEHWSALALGRLPRNEIDRARRFFRRAAVVSPVSHDFGKRIEPLIESTTLRPMPNPVDTNLFSPAPRERNGGVRLLAVGNLTEIKGHRILIDAMATLVGSHPTVSLDVVGDGELRVALEFRARECGVESHVNFHGRLSRHEVAQMMRAADVLVLPSLWENLPCVLLEAMSTGLPVVATRVGGTAEIVDSFSGRLVDSGSDRALADGIVHVINDLGTYDPLAMHRAAHSRYGYEPIARAWTEVYASAMTSFTTGRRVGRGPRQRRRFRHAAMTIRDIERGRARDGARER